MNIYKSIAFAYPTSINAKSLGFGAAGCWFVQHLHVNIEGSGQCRSFVAHNCEGFAEPDDAGLVALYHEYEGTAERSFLKYGNGKALAAIAR